MTKACCNVDRNICKLASMLCLQRETTSDSRIVMKIETYYFEYVKYKNYH